MFVTMLFIYCEWRKINTFTFTFTPPRPKKCIIHTFIEPALCRHPGLFLQAEQCNTLFPLIF